MFVLASNLVKIFLLPAFLILDPNYMLSDFRVVRVPGTIPLALGWMGLVVDYSPKIKTSIHSNSSNASMNINCENNLDRNSNNGNTCSMFT